MTIAVFDFDHTLTDRDSLLHFLFHLHGRPYVSSQLACLGPAFFGYWMGALSRQRMKEEILSRFIAGKSRKELVDLGEDYAVHHLDRLIRQEPLQRLEWHRSQGHRCIIVSATLELYLMPWVALHGFEAVLGSQLEITEAGNATGRLAGLNCWGQEKVRRLIAYTGPKENYRLYAYGDSRGDHELLQLADYPYYRKFK